LSYALQNRDEWAEKGEQITSDLKTEAEDIWHREGADMLANMKEQVATRSVVDSGSESIQSSTTTIVSTSTLSEGWDDETEV